MKIGLISLALNLRRRGFVVIYFGPNSTIDEFHQIIEQSDPQLVCLSACTTNAVENLVKSTYQCQKQLQVITNGNHLDRKKPIFAFGGSIFTQCPELISEVPGLYLGDTIEGAVTKIQEIVIL